MTVEQNKLSMFLEIKREIDDVLQCLLKDIIKAIENKGGFINTQNNGDSFDIMYAYVIPFWTEPNTIEEVKIIAMRVKNNHLELATCASNLTINSVLTEENFDEDDWYTCGIPGDEIFFAQTILSIAESIDQYLNN
jgi:hypothetical protein